MADEKEILRRKVEDGAAPDDPWDFKWSKSDSSRGDHQRKKEYILGFGYYGVRPGETLNITTRPKRTFRPTRLVIPSNIGVDFSVVDLKIGKNSQLDSTQEIPALVFTEHDAYGVKLTGDICYLEMDATIRIRNLSPELREFTCALVGPVIE